MSKRSRRKIAEKRQRHQEKTRHPPADESWSGVPPKRKEGELNKGLFAVRMRAIQRSMHSARSSRR
jgi:hypothetical protein